MKKPPKPNRKISAGPRLPDPSSRIFADTDPDPVESETLRALPFRPTWPLRKTGRPFHDARGWRAVEFCDDKGNRFLRERDGQWERWWRITEQRGDRNKVLYRYKPKPLPVEYQEVIERHDDLDHLCWSFQGWIEEAQESGMYGPQVLTEIKAQLDVIRREVDSLRRKLLILRPPNLVPLA